MNSVTNIRHSNLGRDGREHWVGYFCDKLMMRVHSMTNAKHTNSA